MSVVTEEPDFLQRYARQLCLPEVGLAGQHRLAAPGLRWSVQGAWAYPSPCTWLRRESVV